MNEAQLSCATCSPDDKWVLTGGRDSVTLWDTKTGREVRRFEGHTSEIVSVYFSGDGSMFVSGSRDCTAKLWETETGRNLCTFVEFTGSAPGRSSNRMGGSIPILWNRSTDFTGSSPTNPNGRYLSSYICSFNYIATPPPKILGKQKLPEILTTRRVEPHQPSVAFLRRVREGRFPRSYPGYTQASRSPKGTSDGTTASLFRRQMFMIFVYSAMASSSAAGPNRRKTPPQIPTPWRKTRWMPGATPTASRTAQLRPRSPCGCRTGRRPAPVELTAYAFNEDRVKSTTV